MRRSRAAAEEAQLRATMESWPTAKSCTRMTYSPASPLTCGREAAQPVIADPPVSNVGALTRPYLELAGLADVGPEGGRTTSCSLPSVAASGRPCCSPLTPSPSPWGADAPRFSSPLTEVAYLLSAPAGAALPWSQIDKRGRERFPWSEAVPVHAGRVLTTRPACSHRSECSRHGTGAPFPFWNR